VPTEKHKNTLGRFFPLGIVFYEEGSTKKTKMVPFVDAFEH
jgi:hypothetical protein